MYKLLRSILFLFPTEGVHYFSMNCLKLLCSIGIVRKTIAAFYLPSRRLRTKFTTVTMRNPVGLGAGFDKNAKYLRELECLGFGFIEIGTVTPKPQQGNDKPRLFRLPKDKALINRMGFNNDGVVVIAKRLQKWKEKRRQLIQNARVVPRDLPLVIGGNIGKNKVTPNEEAWKDYETCFKELHPYVDYFVVNVSSPNTPGLRELQEKESLRKILMHLQMINNGKAQSKPILLKIAPDLSPEQIDDVIDLALEIKLDGLVATNTTIDRSNLVTPENKITTIGAGGLSGAPLREKSTEIVKYIAEKSEGKIPIIASGGIFKHTDAIEKKEAGAALLQVWTGFIYEGPGIVKKICRHL
ncbi:MAG: quinone-dependent dihydroorotate dehydrogenase [Chitinophagaceae bacterium]|nr:quinone-dependent dihydroorotate dehydrogenase [Chitinophagaceae bacterium]